MLTTPPILLTIPQAAEALAVSRHTIYRLVNDGLLPAVQMGAGTRSMMRVRHADCLKLVNKLATAPALR
ncbi:AlpA family transcriptional regulator [Cryobacterium sp. N22]|uniref:helix-turn-helix transcriptional regulator n=1 Tax=Cryobacterium sp. N22 TaxID=2048290 RepID=UPI000CE3841D|nr:helix-turn-helix domain-containing protein [Cryobacterium sp. N22]